MNLLQSEPQRGDVAHADEWVSAGLISQTQADAIARYEQSRSEPPGEARRLSIGAEVAVYIGSLIALMGGQMVIARAWDELAYPARLATGLVLAAVGLVAGRALARFEEPGSDRLASFLLAIGTGGVAIAVATTLLELDVEPRAWIAVLTGAAVVIVSGWLWRNRDERPLQFVTGVGGLIAIGAGIANLLDVEVWVVGIVLASASIALGVVARTGLLHPQWLATVASAIGAILGTAMLAELHEEIGLGLACVVAAGVVAVGLLDRDMALLAVGVLGFLITLQAFLAATFNTAVASPVVVAVGLAIVVAALVRTARRRPAAP